MEYNNLQGGIPPEAAAHIAYLQEFKKLLKGKSVSEIKAVISYIEIQIIPKCVAQ